LIAVDTNLLIYAHREDSEFHDNARTALKELAESGQRWGVPWPCVHEFIAITTHPRIFTPPTPLKTALAAIQVWINTPSCECLAEGPGYFDVLKKISAAGKIKGPMVHDARIAALCLDHGVKTLWTADRDFSRFLDLRTHNPLL
jgi:toxin-antitoxin system PIN domain toxin